MPTSDEWGSSEWDLYQSISGGDQEIDEDNYAKELFAGAFLDFDNPYMGYYADELRGYLEQEYGIELDAVFDWEGWREFYDAAS